MIAIDPNSSIENLEQRVVIYYKNSFINYFEAVYL